MPGWYRRVRSDPGPPGGARASGDPRSAGRRIAIVVNNLCFGGAETQAVYLARALVGRGDQVVVVLILPPEAFEDELQRLGVPVHVVGGDAPKAVRVLRRTVALLRTWRPEAVVSFLFHANALSILAGRLARVPVVVTSIRNEQMGGRHRELALRGLLAWSTLEVLNSAFAAGPLVARRVVRSDRLRVIPNAVDTRRFGPDPEARRRLRAELGLDDDDVAWLAIGRLERQKDHETLFDAFDRLATLAPAARLLVVGEGSRRPQVTAMAQAQPGRTRVLGVRDDVPALMAAADGLVLSSRWEGLPNVVMEAMAAGLPVVATRVGGVPELVDDGRTGLVVSAGRADQLAAALAEVTSRSASRRAQMGESARADVRALYSPDEVAIRWFALLDELCEGGKETFAPSDAPVRRAASRRSAPASIGRPSRTDRQTGGEAPHASRPAPPAPPDDSGLDPSTPVSFAPWVEGGQVGAVALFLESFGGGGAQRVFLTMADLLVDRGWETDLVVAVPVGPRRQDLPVKARVVDLGRSRTASSLVPLVRYLRRRRPSVLVSTLGPANLVALAAARLSGTRPAVVLRVANQTSAMARRASGRARLVYWLSRRAYRAADVLAAPSAAAAEDLDAWLRLPPGTTVVLPNPVVTERVLAARPPADDSWFTAGALPVVLSVGRLQPHKGLRNLIEAFADVALRRPTRLLVLGDGPDRADLESLAASLGLGLGPDGQVWFRGFDPDAYSAMAGCHVYVLASEVEGLSGSLIEALACGARVVSTDCPGANEILDGGRFGRIVPVGDRAALAAALEEALDLPPGGPGAAACQSYTPEAAGDAYDAMLRRLVGRRGRRSHRSEKVRA